MSDVVIGSLFGFAGGVIVAVLKYLVDRRNTANTPTREMIETMLQQLREVRSEATAILTVSKYLRKSAKSAAPPLNIWKAV